LAIISVLKLFSVSFIFQFVAIIVFNLMIVVAAFKYEQNMTATDFVDFYILVLMLSALFLKYFTLIFIFLLVIGSNSL
jgi:hypothetical protein